MIEPITQLKEYRIHDASGYSFLVTVLKDQQHDGWKGHITLHCRALLTEPEAVLEDILTQAKQLVRILEDGLKEKAEDKPEAAPWRGGVQLVL